MAPALGRVTARPLLGRGVGVGPSHRTPAEPSRGDGAALGPRPVEARGSHGAQVTLYVFVAPPATHGLGSGPGSSGVQGPRCRRPRPARPVPARAEGVEVVAPTAPSAPPLESDGYPRRKQPVHPNRLKRAPPPQAVCRAGAQCAGVPRARPRCAQWERPHPASWRPRQGGAGLRPWAQALPSTPVRKAFSTAWVPGRAGRRGAGHVPRGHVPPRWPGRPPAAAGPRPGRPGGTRAGPYRPTYERERKRRKKCGKTAAGKHPRVGQGWRRRS